MPSLPRSIARTFLSLLLVLMGVLTPASAQEEPGATGEPGEVVFRLDPEASRVTFTLGATLHSVEGSFAVSRGEVRFDPESGDASGEIVVDVTSGDTGKEGRDEDMHEKVLESRQHSRAVLTPTRVEGSVPESGSGRITLRGSLRLHGSTHEISIPTEVRVEGDQVKATGTFRVPYVEWGMKDPSKFLLRVDKHVDVTIEAVGTLAR